MKVWTPTRLSNGEGRASRGLDRALFGAGAGMIARALDRPRCPQAPPTRGGVTLHDGLHCAARGALPWIGGTINQPPHPALTQASAHTTTQPSASSLPIMTRRPTSPCRKLSRSPTALSRSTGPRYRVRPDSAIAITGMRSFAVLHLRSALLCQTAPRQHRRGRRHRRRGGTPRRRSSPLAAGPRPAAGRFGLLPQHADGLVRGDRDGGERHAGRPASSRSQGCGRRGSDGRLVEAHLSAPQNHRRAAGGSRSTRRARRGARIARRCEDADFAREHGSARAGRESQKLVDAAGAPLRQCASRWACGEMGQCDRLERRDQQRLDILGRHPSRELDREMPRQDSNGGRGMGRSGAQLASFPGAPTLVRYKREVPYREAAVAPSVQLRDPRADVPRRAGLEHGHPEQGAGRPRPQTSCDVDRRTVGSGSCSVPPRLPGRAIEDGRSIALRRQPRTVWLRRRDGTGEAPALALRSLRCCDRIHQLKRSFLVHVMFFMMPTLL